jgi:putative ABC transport system permease protein
VRTEALADSGLLAEGTLFNTVYRLDLPEGTTSTRWPRRPRRAGAIAACAGATRAPAPTAPARWWSGSGRFLVLVGLSGLAVGGVGVSAAVAAYVAAKAEVIATLRTLGASRRTIFASYLLQVGALG